MKLQSFSIVFALIILPLFLVLTYFIQLQVDTITLQSEYDTKLLTATYDAISSFEINTANEDLSSVSDSLRTIIEASNNVFINTLSTNLGLSNASKSFVEPYVPAILYTLYDGYYIAAPTKVPEILTSGKLDANGNPTNQGVAVVVGDEGLDVHNVDNFTFYTYSPNNNPDNPANDKYVAYNDLADNSKDDFSQILYEVDKSKLPAGISLGASTDTYYTTNIQFAKLKTKTVLKSYMPFSARYSRTKDDGSSVFDIMVTYTLDNYVTIEGTKGSIYYTKSGYLLNTRNIHIGNIVVDSNPRDINTFSERDIEKYIEEGRSINIGIKNNETDSDYEEIINIGTNNEADRHSKQEMEDEITFLTNQIEEAELTALMPDSDEKNGKITNVRNNISNKYPTEATLEAIDTIPEQITFCTNKRNSIQYDLDIMSAAVYYSKGYLFTTWVMNEFGENSDIVVRSGNSEKKGVLDTDIREIKGIINLEIDNNDNSFKNLGSSVVRRDGLLKFEGDRPIFKVDGSNQDENTKYGKVDAALDSPFYTHKLDVIRNSIQYNLNLAMTTYAESSKFDYSMPVITDSEWEKILTNPSIVSFMQGINCGLKTYNNYMIASSNNNEICISPDNIYFVPKDLFNNELSEYHKIDCPELITELNSEGVVNHDQLLSFASKDIKYDKFYNKTKSTTHYWYDHKNLACYSCINDSNYLPYGHSADKYNSGTNSYKREQGIFISRANDSTLDSTTANNLAILRRAFYIGVGKERNNLYKPNAANVSSGYEIIYNTNSSNSNLVSPTNTTTKNASQIDYIEVVFGYFDEPVNSIETIGLVEDTSRYYYDTNNIHARYNTSQTRIMYIKDPKCLISDDPSANPDTTISVDNVLRRIDFTRTSSPDVINLPLNNKSILVKFIKVVYK